MNQVGMLDVDSEYCLYLCLVVVVVNGCIVGLVSILHRFSRFDIRNIPIMILRVINEKNFDAYFSRNIYSLIWIVHNQNARTFIQTSIILIILEIDSRLSLRVMINVTLRHSSSFFFASAIDSKTKTSSSASSSSAKSEISSNYFKCVSTFPW